MVSPLRRLGNSLFAVILAFTCLLPFIPTSPAAAFSLPTVSLTETGNATRQAFTNAKTLTQSKLNQLGQASQGLVNQSQTLATDAAAQVTQALQALPSIHSLDAAAKILSDPVLIHQAGHFLDAGQDQICAAYFDKQQGSNHSWLALKEGIKPGLLVLGALNSASVAGAGSLAGYAGIASAVSQLGLGGLTATLASFLGSSATGAAATAVVTSAMGGPVVMAGVLVSLPIVGALGVYEAANFTMDKLEPWAKSHCLLSE